MHTALMWLRVDHSLHDIFVQDLCRVSRRWECSGHQHRRTGRCRQRSCTTLQVQCQHCTYRICFCGLRSKASTPLAELTCAQPIFNSAVPLLAAEYEQAELRRQGQLPSAVAEQSAVPVAPELTPALLASIPRMPPGMGQLRDLG